MIAETQLKILFLGNETRFKELATLLEKNAQVKNASFGHGAHHAWGDIREGFVNTIIIDPFNFEQGQQVETVIEEAASFIFHVRQEFPTIAFVVYAEEQDWLTYKDLLFNVGKGQVGYLGPEELEIYKRERTRLARYYQIIHSKDRAKYEAQIESILAKCVEWHEKIYLVRKNNPTYLYDVALSFSGEDRAFVDDLYRHLGNRGVRAFYDKAEEAELWGKNLYEHLYKIYSKQSRFCIIIVSEHYKNKMWTRHEIRAAQERALMEKDKEYILPVTVEQVDLPGLLKTTAYLNANLGAEKIAQLFEKKLIS